jgi:hypothetical protein
VRKMGKSDACEFQSYSESCTCHAMTHGELNTWSLLPDKQHKLIAIGKYYDKRQEQKV